MLTSNQLHDLTAVINARLEEFAVGDQPLFDALSPGVVRLAYEVISDWQREESYLARREAAQPPQTTVFDELLTRVFEADATPANGHAKPPWSDPTVGEPVPATLPDPDACRDKLAHALANGSGGELAMATPRAAMPRTLAEVDAENEAAQREVRYRYQPTLDELVKELQRQAMGGVGPKKSDFDMARPATWGTASAQCLRLGKSWTELMDIAELKPNRRYEA